MSAQQLALALVQSLDDDALDALALALAPRLRAILSADLDDDQWLTTKDAADHLGITVKALHHRAAAGSIPCHRDSDEKGAKLWFLRSELDQWRRGEYKCPQPLMQRRPGGAPTPRARHRR